MAAKTHLAIDIGASSGRHILGWLEDGTLRLEEIHRFPNGMKQIGGTLCWDVDALYSEMLAGMKKCSHPGKRPISVGVDTWGVDFVLLDSKGERVGPAAAYRDSRTEGMDAEVSKFLPEPELYARTGIQKLIFNTIYQLMAIKTGAPHTLEKAAHLLMIPDYLHYKLCGVLKNEYTAASTTALLNAETKDWDDEIIERCGFPRGIFREIVPAGTIVGGLASDARQSVGYDCTVALPPTHDTASAFLAVPAKSGSSVYISSGTWSLMGVELDKPITSEASRAANFSNEGGYAYKYRYLKNIMGLWILQSVHREIGDGIGFDDLEAMTRASGCESLIEVGEDRFFAPENMAGAIAGACRESGQAEPRSIGDFSRCVCRSLADSYAGAVKVLQTLTGKEFEYINITGGGSENRFLNEATAKACGLPVLAGPAEGTALGNIVSQMIAFGELSGPEAARDTIRRSFGVREVLP